MRCQQSCSLLRATSEDLGQYLWSEGIGKQAHHHQNISIILCLYVEKQIRVATKSFLLERGSLQGLDAESMRSEETMKEATTLSKCAVSCSVHSAATSRHGHGAAGKLTVPFICAFIISFDYLLIWLKSLNQINLLYLKSILFEFIYFWLQESCTRK